MKSIIKKNGERAPMKLIFHADDFGMCSGVNYGIMDAFRYGIVRSTSLLAVGKGFKQAVEIAKQSPEMDIGVHLSLTFGRPISRNMGDLVDAQGNFHRLNWFEDRERTIDKALVEKEFTAQIEKILATGLKPSHLDSHHHVHMIMQIFPVFLKLARKYSLAVRVRSRNQIPDEYADLASPSLLMEEFYGDQANISQLVEILQVHKDKTRSVEIMCHPGYIDKFLYTHSSYAMQRIDELAILTSPATKEVIHTAGGVELTSYKKLAEHWNG